MTKDEAQRSIRTFYVAVKVDAARWEQCRFPIGLRAALLYGLGHLDALAGKFRRIRQS